MSAGSFDWTEPLRWKAIASRVEPQPDLKGLDAMRRSAEGFVARRMPRTGTLLRKARRIEAVATKHRAASPSELGEMLQESRDAIRRGRAPSEQCWGALCECAARVLGMRPYPNQIAAAIAIDGGYAVELATGEGKTLVIGLASTIAGWRGDGCHVVTFNDYLAQRDRDWMLPLHRECGVRSAALLQDTAFDMRRDAYAADITYLTSKEAAADYLRDELARPSRRGIGHELLDQLNPRTPSRPRLMRGLAQAIVDEADSILLDEAVTPLIISRKDESGALCDLIAAASRTADRCVFGIHYMVVEAERAIRLSARGRQLAVEELVSQELGISSRRAHEVLTDAITARAFFTLGKQYLIDDGAVVLVDEHTGRRVPDRSWRHGFHQAIEAKEGLELTPIKETLARISFQRFFRMYSRLGALSGTMAEGSGEFWSAYSQLLIRLPTHRPCIRKKARTRRYRTAAQRDDAVIAEITEAHRNDQPVLLGVRHTSDAERLSTRLSRLEIPHRVLSATEHSEEAEIVARSGQAGAVTVATNMAGRGTDIALDEHAREVGGLRVLACEQQASPRIDRQLLGRAGRQGDPGMVRIYASLEDELITRYCGAFAAVVRSLGGRDLLPRALGAALWSLATLRASRAAVRRRKAVLSHDAWISESLSIGDTPSI